jgi:hypothetical protein
MSRFLWWGILVAAVSCGGGQDPCKAAADFPQEPLLSTSSDTGALQLALRSSPQPLARGTNTVQYTITNDAGTPITGLSLDVVPWMPDMGHGSSIKPTVAERGQGVYVVSCVDLAMPGSWQLRTAASGPVSDSATPAFQIP